MAKVLQQVVKKGLLPFEKHGKRNLISTYPLKSIT
jgi:hypothetical protein